MKKRMLAVILVLTALLMGATGAEGYVSGRLDGNALLVEWQAPAGMCDLTVYRGDWPICVRQVGGGAGSLTLSLGDASGTFKLRLRTDAGCYTATVQGEMPTTPAPTAIPTADPTAIPAEKPTQAPTEKPTQAPTEIPTAAPTEKPTQMPTVRPTAAPTEKPTQVPTARPTAAPSTERGDLAQRVVDLVNEARAAQGLKPLHMDAGLNRAARVRAEELTRVFSHTRPDGSAWSTVSSSAFAENIARGQRTADKVVAAWLSSGEGHRENILRASYGSIGVCALNHGGVMYWVQLFGR